MVFHPELTCNDQTKTCEAAGSTTTKPEPGPDPFFVAASLAGVLASADFAEATYTVALTLPQLPSDVTDSWLAGVLAGKTAGTPAGAALFRMHAEPKAGSPTTVASTLDVLFVASATESDAKHAKTALWKLATGEDGATDLTATVKAAGVKGVSAVQRITPGQAGAVDDTVRAVARNGSLNVFLAFGRKGPQQPLDVPMFTLKLFGPAVAAARSPRMSDSLLFSPLGAVSGTLLRSGGFALPAPAADATRLAPIDALGADAGVVAVQEFTTGQGALGIQSVIINYGVASGLAASNLVTELAKPADPLAGEVDASHRLPLSADQLGIDIGDLQRFDAGIEVMKDDGHDAVAAYARWTTETAVVSVRVTDLKTTHPSDFTPDKLSPAQRAGWGATLGGLVQALQFPASPSGSAVFGQPIEPPALPPPS
jgi:hypothetical protein